MDEAKVSLLVSHVPRTLETKSKLLGLELSDILVLLMNLSLQNLVFGTTSLKFPMVFGTTAIIAGVLFFFKRGKPDLYLQHFTEHLLAPAVRSANGVDSIYRPFNSGGTHE
jgi:hypothetical protein